ncbi:MAG: hypothetical protein CEE43_11745 [Promethearchaeota archaeon Loki_b32]|nr:MAG: hypothetical protein CEE43_11745 [Candidatus Lokiarchaeota archaeon Loki_b32]
MVNKAREQNIYAGITISVLITVISYIIISLISLSVGFAILFLRFFLFADPEYILGTLFGVIFFLKNRRPDQSILKYGVVVGIVGGIISSFFISLYQWILLFYFSVFIAYLVTTLITGVFIGLLIGAILSAYFMYKEVKGEGKEEYYDDEFFKDLIEE